LSRSLNMSGRRVDSDESIHLLGALLRALPKESMLEGINTRGRNAKKPDPHQLLCTDYLTRPWLELVFKQPVKTRSRLVIADEGGVGKTINVCMFIKHLLVNGYNGPDSDERRITWRNPIIIITPATRLVQMQWKNDLEAILAPTDASSIVLGITHLKHGQPGNRIHIVSKHSIGKMLNEFENNSERMLNFLSKGHGGTKTEPLEPALVVVDELHEGRTSAADSKHTQLWNSVKSLNLHSTFAIGLTATPVNLEGDELVRMMDVLGKEASAYAGHLKGAFSAMSAEKMEEWIEITETLSEMNISIQNGKTPEMEAMSKLGTLVNHQAYPASDQEKQTIVEALENGNFDEDFWQHHGPKFLRELHPLGRHMSLLRRADLGEEYCKTRYRTRTTDNLELKWPNHLQKWFEDRKLWRSEGRGKLPDYSHSWPWNDEFKEIINEEYTTPPVQHIRDDPRLSRLKTLLKEDSENTEHKMRGAVIFCQYKPTVNGIHEHLSNYSDQYQLLKATGDDENEATKQLNKAKLQAKKIRGKYPVVICTQIGDVGIDMEWATLCIHWDMGANPQSCEQRSWRLDRRWSNHSMVSKKFRIVRMGTNHPHNVSQRDKLDERTDLACQILGLPDDAVVRYGDAKENIVQTYNSGLIFSISSSELKDILASLGHLQEVNESLAPTRSMLNIKALAAKVMWQILNACETIKSDPEKLEQFIVQSEWTKDEFDQWFGITLEDIRMKASALPEHEARTLNRLLSPALQPVDERAWKNFQELSIANTTSDEKKRPRAMIHHDSEFLKNTLQAQGLSNTDLASVDPVLIKSGENLAHLEKGAIYLVNYNPRQLEHNTQPGWMTGGSLWFTSVQGGKSRIYPISNKHPDSMEALHVFLATASEKFYHDTSFRLTKISVNEKQVKYLKSQVLAMSKKGPNGIYRRRLESHFGPKRGNNTKDWPEFSVRCLAVMKQ
jgi:hypothetical protein